MNITDDKLDDLFRSELDKEKKYQNAEEQWQIVADRLGRKKRKWFLLLSIGLALFIITMGYNILETNLPSVKGKTNYSEAYPSLTEQKDIPLTKEIKDVSQSTAPALISESQESMSSKLSIPQNPEKSKNLITNVSKENLSSSTEKELCDCPDDFISNSGEKSDASQIQINSIEQSQTSTVSKTIEQPQSQIIDQLSDLERLPNKSIPLLVLEKSIPLSNTSSLRADCGEYYIPTKPKVINRFYLSAGLINDIYSSPFIDSTSMSPYLGLGFELVKNIAVELRYNQQNTNRSFGNGFLTEDYLGTYGQLESTSMTSGNARYKTHTLDLGINYKLLRKKNFSLSALGGMQIDKQQAGDLSLTVETVYLTNTQNFELAAGSLRLRKSYLGLGFDYNILSGINLELQYRRMIPISADNLNWGQYNRFSLGLSYHF